MRTFLALCIACLVTQSAVAQYTITKGATNQTVYLRIIDSADGTPETAVAYDTASIDLEYVRAGAAAVDITEATQTAAGAHSDGGFVHVGHGVYRLDLPDAAVATGVNSVEVIGTVPDMIVIGPTIQLTGADLQSTLLTLSDILTGIFEADPLDYDVTDNFADLILRVLKTGKNYTVDSENDPTTGVNWTEE